MIGTIFEVILAIDDAPPKIIIDVNKDSPTPVNNGGIERTSIKEVAIVFD